MKLIIVSMTSIDIRRPLSPEVHNSHKWEALEIGVIPPHAHTVPLEGGRLQPLMAAHAIKLIRPRPPTDDYLPCEVHRRLHRPKATPKSHRKDASEMTSYTSMGIGASDENG